MTASAAILTTWFASGCTVHEQPTAPSPFHALPHLAVVDAEPAPQSVVSVYVDPPMYQPAPIAVPWAPPPLLVEVPPPMPFAGAVWTGGYWVWNGDWVWAAGRWAPPPRPDYAWVHPYYEHRDDMVIFITGHWAPPGVVFVTPPPGIRLNMAIVAVGARPGHAPIGPQGVFLPPPPGSRPGLIVPAPVGTPPAVLTSAPPVVNVGMRIQNTVNNTRITNVSNITNVTIIAPAAATSNGRPFASAVPAQAHLAAALPSVVHMMAPVPVVAKPMPVLAPGRAPVVLPEPQVVHAAPTMESRPMRPRNPSEQAFPAPMASAPSDQERVRSGPREGVHGMPSAERARDGARSRVATEEAVRAGHEAELGKKRHAQTDKAAQDKKDPKGD